MAKNTVNRKFDAGDYYPKIGWQHGLSLLQSWRWTRKATLKLYCNGDVYISYMNQKRTIFYFLHWYQVSHKCGCQQQFTSSGWGRLHINHWTHISHWGRWLFFIILNGICSPNSIFVLPAIFHIFVQLRESEYKNSLSHPQAILKQQKISPLSFLDTATVP